jgi:hydrogenase maturation factor
VEWSGSERVMAMATDTSSLHVLAKEGDAKTLAVALKSNDPK